MTKLLDQKVLGKPTLAKQMSRALKFAVVPQWHCGYRLQYTYQVGM